MPSHSKRLISGSHRCFFVGSHHLDRRARRASTRCHSKALPGRSERTGVSRRLAARERLVQGRRPRRSGRRQVSTLGPPQGPISATNCTRHSRMQCRASSARLTRPLVFQEAIALRQMVQDLKMGSSRALHACASRYGNKSDLRHTRPVAPAPAPVAPGCRPADHSTGLQFLQAFDFCIVDRCGAHRYKSESLYVCGERKAGGPARSACARKTGSRGVKVRGDR